MNIFEISLINSILILFPMVVYLLYLSTNKKLGSSEVYKVLSLVSSFYLLYRFNTSSINAILILNVIVILSYVEDKYILANVFSMSIVILYRNEFNYIWILVVMYIIGILLYIFKHIKNRNVLFLELFVFESSIIYFMFSYKYNNCFSISTIISYIMISNLAYRMNILGKRILNTHMTYKELQKEKQVKLSLFKITHEIKNPIAVCKGYLDMLNIKDSKQVEKYIPIIKSEIERLLGILQDYLLINKVNMDLDIMDINMLLEDTIDKMEPIIKEKNICMDMKLVDDEVFINGDYNRLSQVMVNIIKNSIEAININDGIIKVRSIIESNNYFITIEDNGCGMTRDVLSKMREPFYTTKSRGSGLGVSLIYDIVEAHKGNVDYESECGRGTKVTLKFPIYQN